MKVCGLVHYLLQVFCFISGDGKISLTGGASAISLKSGHSAPFNLMTYHIVFPNTHLLLEVGIESY